MLAGELGVDPGPELRLLQQQILAADPALVLTGNGSAAPGPPTPGLPASGVAGSGHSRRGWPGHSRRGWLGHSRRPRPARYRRAQPARHGRARHRRVGRWARAACLGAQPGLDGAAAMRAPVPRQLPVATRHFAGRAGALAALAGLAAEAGGADGASRATAISAIGGTAGIGKTALAVQWAHRVAGRVPGRAALCEPARFRPVRGPGETREAVRRFLEGFAVPGAQPRRASTPSPPCTAARWPAGGC